MSSSKSQAAQWRQVVRKHLDTFLGTPLTVYTPHDRCQPRVSVAEYPPRPEHPYWTYVTIGMSAKKQHIPDKSPEWLTPRVEIFCYVPQRAKWPVEVLNLLGRLPSEQQSYVFWWHTVDCGGPLDEMSDTTVSAMLLLPPYFEDEGFDKLKEDGTKVRFLFALPVTEAERRLALARGGQALEELLLAENVDFVFDPLRPSVV